MSLQQPVLAPERCYSEHAFRTFLTLSRSLTDDAISADINSLQRAAYGRGAGNTTASSISSSEENRRDTSSKRLCRDHVEKAIFTSWKARDDILEYCSLVAEKNKSHKVQASETKSKIDPRIDPYGARNLPEFTEEDRIFSWINNEKMVEDIVRGRSWSIISDRCAEYQSSQRADGSDSLGDYGSEWRSAYESWRSKYLKK
ncbi:caffeine-induced death protein 2-domain-containing protein [Dipodascopsis uninucleata]